MLVESIVRFCSSSRPESRSWSSTVLRRYANGGEYMSVPNTRRPAPKLDTNRSTMSKLYARLVSNTKLGAEAAASDYSLALRSRPEKPSSTKIVTSGIVFASSATIHGASSGEPA